MSSAPAMAQRLKRRRHDAGPLCLVATASWLGVSLLGCETWGVVLGLADSSTPGVGPGEAGPGEAGPGEAGPGEAGPSEAGPSEAGPSEAGSTDAGPIDAAPRDAGPSDAGAPSSCVAAATGTTNCSGESCCTSPPVAGGMYSRVYANNGGGATGLANPASVSGFRLDKYIVTVGRFRQFVSAWSAGYTPPPGSGKHTHLNGGLGLANSASLGTYEPGWASSDGNSVAPTSANLACDSTKATWTDSPGGNENLPITCPNWYEAYAFCIWDGGFLPSEAEWEYAAAGGSELREYPWGVAPPGTGSRYAIYGCYYPAGLGTCMGGSNIAPVGTATLGAGKWGQLDLTGEVYQLTLDSYADYVDPCTDCAFLTTAVPFRVRRGGAFGYDESLLHPAVRHDDSPGLRDPNFGFRCARAP